MECADHQALGQAETDYDNLVIMSFSNLLKSYGDNGRAIMKGSVVAADKALF